ncbi:hypothetical protein E4T56_gene5319 [Termitomyces sp. T112]|nr:hypothetical protein E4T56_gene5319 [Termitomyces sp. T112]
MHHVRQLPRFKSDQRCVIVKGQLQSPLLERFNACSVFLHIDKESIRSFLNVRCVPRHQYRLKDHLTLNSEVVAHAPSRLLFAGFELDRIVHNKVIRNFEWTVMVFGF